MEAKSKQTLLGTWDWKNLKLSLSLLCLSLFHCSLFADLFSPPVFLCSWLNVAAQ